jgi:type IV secretory pathway VirB2 component (pilin)
MNTFPSLFDAPASPTLSTTADWVNQTIFGSVAEDLCVIAVAIVGFTLMTGRLAVRDAVRVVIGCFVLLAAPAIAADLWSLADRGSQPDSAIAIDAADLPPVPKLPPANYDPYAGASLPIQ